VENKHGSERDQGSQQISGQFTDKAKEKQKKSQDQSFHESCWKGEAFS
jgi:hypothetical protein